MTAIPMTVLTDSRLHTLWFDVAREVSRRLPRAERRALDDWMRQPKTKWWEWPSVRAVMGDLPDMSIPVPTPGAPLGSDPLGWTTFGELERAHGIPYTVLEKWRSERVIPVVPTDKRRLLIRKTDAAAFIERVLNAESVTVLDLRPVVAPQQPPMRKARRAVGVGLRFRVLSRDNFTCRYCGRSAPEVPIEADHVYPASLGGPSTLDNLVAACWDCNHGKRNRVLEVTP
jgi:5-methylcytosine-specific restriction endonuclease McrA